MSAAERCAVCNAKTYDRPEFYNPGGAEVFCCAVCAMAGLKVAR